MIKFKTAIYSLIFLCLACTVQTYQGSIQTAIVQTQTAIPTSTWTPSPSPTPLPTNTPQPSPTNTPAPTREASLGGSPSEPSEEMKGFITKLNNEKILNTLEGKFYQLKNFEQSSNKVGPQNMILVDTGHSPKQFILRADYSWAVDASSAGVDYALCAPVFNFYQKDNNFYLYAFGLGETSPTNLLRSTNGILSRVNRGKSPNLKIPEGKAKIAIVMLANTIRLYVDNNLIDTATYSGFATVGEDAGSLSIGMLSGNANGYGTRISLTNIELWEIP